MKLAEALVLRADLQKRVQNLKARLAKVVQIQEGDQPVESPDKLLGELADVIESLQKIIININHTNAQTQFDNSVRTLMSALAERDMLLTRRSALQSVVERATERQNRYGQSEIRYVVTVDVASLQRQIDDLSRRYRELDTQIQQQNWLVDLTEVSG